MGLNMNDYLAIIKETFPELNIQDFSVLGKGNLAATCLVNKNIVFKITGTSEKKLFVGYYHNILFVFPKISPHTANICRPIVTTVFLLKIHLESMNIFFLLFLHKEVEKLLLFFHLH